MMAPHALPLQFRAHVVTVPFALPGIRSGQRAYELGRRVSRQRRRASYLAEEMPQAGDAAAVRALFGYSSYVKTPRAPVPPADAEPSARAPAAALGRLALLYLLVLLPVGWLGLPRTLVSAGALAALQGGVLVLVMLRDRGRARFRWRPHRRDAAEAGVIAAGLLGALALASLLAGALPDPLRESLLRGYRWELQGAAQVPLALGFVLISAYREELYFRAYLLTVLEEIATPPWLAVLTSALLFGLGHLYQGWLAAGTALLIGVAFALLYRQRPAVHRLAWAHAAFNLAVLTGTLFAG